MGILAYYYLNLDCAVCGSLWTNKHRHVKHGRFEYSFQYIGRDRHVTFLQAHADGWTFWHTPTLAVCPECSAQVEFDESEGRAPLKLHGAIRLDITKPDNEIPWQFWRGIHVRETRVSKLFGQVWPAGLPQG